MCYRLGGHSISAGYQEAAGNSDFPHLNSGNGQALTPPIKMKLG